MPDDSSPNSLLPPRRRRRVYAGVIEGRPRNVEDLLAEVLFGVYWHDGYYRNLPAELRPWESALVPTIAAFKGQLS